MLMPIISSAVYFADFIKRLTYMCTRNKKNENMTY